MTVACGITEPAPASGPSVMPPAADLSVMSPPSPPSVSSAPAAPFPAFTAPVTTMSPCASMVISGPSPPATVAERVNSSPVMVAVSHWMVVSPRHSTFSSAPTMNSASTTTPGPIVRVGSNVYSPSGH
ncbi:MAG TPA: hypothetical protein DGT21_25310 [Armatimonadetes bacterium]|nr:hypothetical protein [Armatimonadota bacterium]